MVVLVRRLTFALVATIAIFDNDPHFTFASIAMLGILLLALVVHFALWPYKSALASWIEACATAMCAVSLMLVVGIVNTVHGSTSSRILNAAFLVGNICMCFVFIAALVWPIITTLR